MFPLSFCVYKDLYTCVEDTAQQSYIPQQGHLRYTQSFFRQTSLHLTAKKKHQYDAIHTGQFVHTQGRTSLPHQSDLQ